MEKTKDILDAFHWRCAVKQFDASKGLSPEQVAFLKEVLRLSPSSFGLQPWRFVFVARGELRKKLREKAWNQAQIEDCSQLIVLCRPEGIGQGDVDKLVTATGAATGAPPESLEGMKKMISGFVSGLKEERAAAWMEDQVYIALGILLAACAQAGIDACPMGGFEGEGFDELLGLRDKGLRSVVLCAVGTRAGSDKYAKRAKVRYPTGDVILSV